MPHRNTELRPDTLNLEKKAELSLNYLCGNLDGRRKGLPYFRTFLRPDPPEARHDWSDYGDITGRFVDAIILARHMTGSKKGEKEEKMLKELLLSYFSEDDGLSYREDTSWSKHDAIMFDQSRVLTALVTWYLQTGEDRIKKVAAKMIHGLWAIAVKEKNYCYYLYKAYPPTGWNKNYDGELGTRGKADPCYDGGILISPLVRFYQATESEAALNLARNLVNWNVYHSDVFSFDRGSFKGHFHSRLATLAGVLRYALATENSELIEWSRRVYNYALGLGGSSGWYPEDTEEKEGCETCGIADMIDAGILLAKAGYPEYWNVVERIARNHLVESQFEDISWIKWERHKEDTERSSFNNVAQRVRGAFAGWSAPNDFISRRASRIVQKDNPYQLMNCCGPAGARALYLLWQNIVTKNQEGVSINLGLNRDSQWVNIHSFRPYEGRVEIFVKQVPVLLVRIPDWVPKNEVELDGSKIFEWRGDYLKLSNLKKGQIVRLTYPLREEQGKKEIGGREFLLCWKGDTVVGISPQGENYPLYQRENYRARKAPQRRMGLHSPDREIYW